jgi:carbon monoxide dehydrogenase subunit G
VANFEYTVTIRNPIQQVFGFLSDFENLPGGTTPSSRPTRSPRGPWAWGRSTSKSARFRAEAKSASRSPPTTRPAGWRYGQLGPFPSRLSYALDTVPEGTRVTNSVELELRGPGRLLGRVAVPRVRDAVAANLRKLKELLEQ